MKRKMSSRERESGFTLGELLVVVAVIAILVGLFVPTLARAKLSSARIICANNERQQIVAALLYADEDKNGALAGTKDPADSGVYGWLYPDYVGGNRGVFRCPAARNVVSPGGTHRTDGAAERWADALRRVAGAPEALGLAHYTFGFYKTGGEFREDELELLRADLSQINPGIRKTLNNTAGRVNRTHSFGLHGVAVGPADIIQVVDADRLDKDWEKEPFYIYFPDKIDPHGKGNMVGFVDGHVRFISSKNPADYLYMYEQSADSGLQSRAKPTAKLIAHLRRLW